MSLIKHIPNTITCLNLFSGCMSVVTAASNDLHAAFLWIVSAAIFDFMDGFAARLLKAYSPMGKELDSLSDVVSFGVAPGMIVYALFSQAAIQLQLQGNWAVLLPLFAFVIPVFSGLRLAKFNIDDRQTFSFIGLPVPAHALFWGSLAYSVQAWLPTYASWLLYGGIILACLTSYLLISEIPMFSMKVKSVAWKGNEYRYILLLAAILFITFWGYLGVTGAIVLYFILSLFNRNK